MGRLRTARGRHVGCRSLPPLHVSRGSRRAAQWGRHGGRFLQLRVSTLGRPTRGRVIPAQAKGAQSPSAESSKNSRAHTSKFHHSVYGRGNLIRGDHMATRATVPTPTIPPVQPQPGPQPPKPQPQPSADDKTCKFAGVEYSGGATVRMPGSSGGDVVKTCNPNTGRWD